MRRRHWIAFVVMLGVGCIYASHHFFIATSEWRAQTSMFAQRPSDVASKGIIPFIPRLIAGGRGIYNPLPPSEYGDETLLYGPRAYAAFEDFRVRGDFSLAEYTTSPALLPMLSPLLLGGLGKIFGSFTAGVIASDMLFPSLIFLVLYFLMQEIGVSTGASLLFSLIFIIVPKFGVSLPPLSSAHISTLSQLLFPYLTKSDVLFFSQFDEPKLTFLFFAFSVYAIIRALKRQGNRNMILAGISFGVLFYTYLYDWATILTSLTLMAVFFLWKKDYRRVKQIGMIAGMGIFVSAYYWINLFHLAHLMQHKDIIARLGGEFSHHVRFASVWKSYIRAIALVVLLWAMLGKKMRETAIMLSAMLLSYVVVVNEQVITGFNVQPDHWYRTQFLPIAVSVFLLLCWAWRRYAHDRIKSLFEKSVFCCDSIISAANHSGFVVVCTAYAFLIPHGFRSKLWNLATKETSQTGSKKYAGIACAIVILYMLTAFLAGQYSYSRERADIFAMTDVYQESFEWLENNTQSDAVIGSFSIRTNLDLQLHTSRKIFMPFALSTIAPDEELWRRAMIMSSLWGISWDEFKNRFSKGGGANYLFGDEYGDHTFDANFFTYHWQIPEDVLVQKSKEYAEMVSAKKPLGAVYRLDYLFVDKKEFPSWKEPMKLAPSLKKVFENERVAIFKIEL